MDFPNCFTQAHYGITFGGLHVSQSWNDLGIWEEFFNRAGTKSFIELGTFKGGTTVYFQMQGLIRGFSVTSIDSTDHGVPIELLTKLGVKLLTVDLLSEATVEPIRELIDSLPKPLALFCDNGNKPVEWNRFFPLLSPGDFATVHDWGTEFHESNLIPNPTLFMQAECELTQSMTRFFAI